MWTKWTVRIVTGLIWKGSYIGEQPNEVVSSVSEQGNTTGSSAKGPSGHNSSVKECITHVMGLGNVRSHKQSLKTS